MNVLIIIESNRIERRNVVEDGDGGLCFRRLGRVSVFQSLYISSFPVSKLAALVYVGNLSQSQYQMWCDLLMW